MNETEIKTQILEEQGRHHDTVFYTWEEFEGFVRLMWRGTFETLSKGAWRDNAYKDATDEVMKHIGLKGRVEIHLNLKQLPIDVSKVTVVGADELPKTLDIHPLATAVRSLWNDKHSLASLAGRSPATYKLPWGQVKPKQEWVDEESGYACFMRLEPALNVLCAYVLLPLEHPWCRGISEGQLEQIVDVVGREITFTGTLADNDEHNMQAYPGLYAVGFDGAQDGDYVPTQDRPVYEFTMGYWKPWRAEKYMREAVKKLAGIAKAAALAELTTTLNEKFKGLYPKAVDGNDAELDAHGTTLLIRAVSANTFASIFDAAAAAEPDPSRRHILLQIQHKALEAGRHYAKEFKQHGENLIKAKRPKR